MDNKKRNQALSEARKSKEGGSKARGDKITKGGDDMSHSRERLNKADMADHTHR